MDTQKPSIMTISLVIVLCAIIFGGLGYYLGTNGSTSTTTLSTETKTEDATLDYPAVIKPLSSDELAVLTAEFKAANPKVCATINKYGFTENQSNCQFNSSGKVSDETTATEAIKDWVIKNAKYTGVADKSDLTVTKADNTLTLFKVTFKNPFEGDVKTLAVFYDNTGVWRIDGYHVANSSIPTEPVVTEASAKAALIGKKLTYSDIAGKPQDVILKQEDLTRTASKVTYIKETSLGLEQRLAWKITAGQGMNWTIYIDAITGEELATVQNFQT